MAENQNNDVGTSQNKTPSPQAPKNIPEKQVDEPKFDQEMDEETKAP